MSAEFSTKAVRALPSVASRANFSKDEAWNQLKTTVEKFISSNENLASFRAPPSMKQLIYQIQKDYAQNANNLSGRPNIITHCRGGVTIWLTGTTQTPSDFVILEPIFSKGKVRIGGVDVDMNHYYVIIEKCDVIVEDDDGVLVTLAMTDIR